MSPPPAPGVPPALRPRFIPAQVEIVLNLQPEQLLTLWGWGMPGVGGGGRMPTPRARGHSWCALADQAAPWPRMSRVFSRW